MRNIRVQLLFVYIKNEIVSAIYPKPNRAIICDAGIPHAAIAPDLIAPISRRVLVFQCMESSELCKYVNNLNSIEMKKHKEKFGE